MSNYIIPDGWNPMTEPWEEWRTVNLMHKNGTVSSTTKTEIYVRGTDVVAWQYPVPLKKKRRFEVGADWSGITCGSCQHSRKWSVFDVCIPWDDPARVCAQNIKSKEHAEAFAKYLEETEP